MGYKIHYGPRILAEKKKGRWKIAVAVALGLAIILVAWDILTSGYPMGIWLLPGDGEVTAMALDTMVESIRDGEPLGEAITIFCKEIIDHAQTP